LNRRLAPVAVIALLGLGGILQGGASPTGADDPAPAPIREPGPAGLPRAPADRASPEQRQARLTALEARPLFALGRVPRRSEPPGPAEPAQPPRLAGVIVMQGVRRAMFAATDGRQLGAVAEGGHLGPFTVTAITAGEVQLSGPAGAYTLRPSFDAGLRSRFALNDRIVPLVDPIRRETETESDQ